MTATITTTADLIAGLFWTGGIVIALAVFTAIGERLGVGEILMYRRIKNRSPRRRPAAADPKASFDHVAGWLHARYEAHIRTRLIITVICEADPFPEDNEKATTTYERLAA